MQQLYAQLHVDLVAGKQWWLTKEEEALLADSNREHRTVSSIREGLTELVDTSRIGAPDCRLLGTNDALKLLGINQPRNGQNKEAAAVLRDLLGEPRKYQGNMKWRVPLREQACDEPLGTYSHLPLAEPCSPQPDSSDSEGF